MRLPLPWADLGLIALCALACHLAILWIETLPGGSVLALTLIALGAAGLAWHLNLIGVADLARRRLGRAS